MSVHPSELGRQCEIDTAYQRGLTDGRREVLKEIAAMDPCIDERGDGFCYFCHQWFPFYAPKDRPYPEHKSTCYWKRAVEATRKPEG